MTAEREGGDGHDLVAHAETAHSRTDRRDPSAALGAEGNRAVGQAGVDPQGLHHVAEVQRGGTDLDLDLARSGWATAKTAQSEPVQAPRAAGLQAVCGPVVIRVRARSREWCRHDPPDKPASGAKCDFIFVVLGPDLV